MNRFIFYLIAVLVYYPLVVLTHKEVGRFVATNLDKPLGRPTYNLIVLIAGLITLLLYLVPFFKGLKLHNKEERRRLLFYLIFTVILCIASINIILVINVEIIHMLQYCILALLLFPIFKNYTSTLLVGSILGALDEVYQYLVLFPHRSKYFDFNDVFIDFLGVALGLILLKANGTKEKLNIVTWYKSFSFIVLILIFIAGIFSYFLGYFTIYPADPENSKVVFQFIKEVKDGFWQNVPPKGTRFHIMTPLEFILITIPLSIFYVKLWRR